MSVLAVESNAELTPAAFGEWLRKRIGRRNPFRDQTVRNWIGEGMPAVREGRVMKITDPEACFDWWRANKGNALQGGAREGAGRKGKVAQHSVLGSGLGADSEDPARSAGLPDGGRSDMNEVKHAKLDIETRLKQLDYDVKTGKYIEKDLAEEGTIRVLSVVVRELTKLPDKLADAAADRMRLESEERSVLRGLVADRVDELRRWIAEHPFGVDEDETQDGRRDAAPTPPTSGTEAA